MAVKIRLARAGAKKAPFYRIVATDSRSPRDGRFIEILGRYNPRTHPSTIEMDVEKVDAWVAKGAQMSETVGKLVAIVKNPEVAAPETGEKLSKKAKAKVVAEAEAAEKAAADAAKAKEEAKAAEKAAAEAPAEEPAAEEEAPAEEAAAEEAPADEAEAEEAPAEEADAKSDAE